MKTCSRCKATKEQSEFYGAPRGRWKDRLFPWCKACCRENGRARRAQSVRPWPEGVQDAASRLWAKVDKVNGPMHPTRPELGRCWPFTGCVDRKGYGRIRCGGESRLAHRVAFVLGGGDPEADPVMHSCNLPPCCNPAHHEAGTDVENNQYMRDCGRQAVGERLPQSKLTESDVREMRTLAASGITQRVIADRFGVHQATVSYAVRGLTWHHVPQGG